MSRIKGETASGAAGLYAALRAFRENAGGRTWRIATVFMFWLLPQPLWAADLYWFDDIEKQALLRETRVDVSGPEPASFTALGVAPFVTAQALASSDIAFSATQIIDDHGNPRGAVGLDLAPWNLVRGAHVTLGDYKHNRVRRFISRIQLSFAASRGESHADKSLHAAPTLRIVLHEERDPRVHRGPGSLKDCFAAHVAPPVDIRVRQADLEARIAALQRQAMDPQTDGAAAQLARAELDTFRAERQANDELYAADLQRAVREGMAACRSAPDVAGYTWNATGYAFGFSPSFRTRPDDRDSLRLKGYTVWLTAAYGFDPKGRQPSFEPTFLGRHVQILGQLMFRKNVTQLDPERDETESDKLIASARLRAGDPALAGNIEAAFVHDWFHDGDQDTYYRLTGGADIHVARGLWLSASIGRTFWRGLFPNETSVRVSLKKTILD